MLFEELAHGKLARCREVDEFAVLGEKHRAGMRAQFFVPQQSLDI